MGSNVDDIPWPSRKPKRPKAPKQPKKGSGGGDGRIVGMAIAIFATPPALFIGGLVYVWLDARGN